MKVKIGPYKNWFGPYQFVNLFEHIFGKERIDNFTETKIFDKLSDWTLPLFQWIDEHKPKRKEYVRIDPYDTWSMDHTLALITLPMLKQLKETKHGAPATDDDDVPEELRSTNCPQPKDGDTDDNWFKRWDWIMDEMIFAFEHIVDDSWEQEFHTGENDFIEKTVIKNDTVYFEITEGPNHTSKFDKDGWTKVNERINNGTRLFGKYYQNLWD